jgi:hypothetical protein
VPLVSLVPLHNRHALHTVSKRLLRRHLWGSEAGRPFYLLPQMSPSLRRCYYQGPTAAAPAPATMLRG